MLLVLVNFVLKERTGLSSRVEELEEMLEAEREKLQKKAESISSDEDMEHQRQALQENLQSSLDELHEEAESLRWVHYKIPRM